MSEFVNAIASIYVGIGAMFLTVRLVTSAIRNLKDGFVIISTAQLAVAFAELLLGNVIISILMGWTK